MGKQQEHLQQINEVSLKEIFLFCKRGYRYLRSRWIIILIAAIIGGLLGFLYSLYKKPVYTAKLTFALEERSASSSLGAYSDLASQFGFQLGGNSASGAFSGDNIMELVKSRRIVTKTLLTGIKINGRKQSLADYYIEINHLRNKWKKSGKVPVDLSFTVNANPDSLSFIQDSIMGNFYQTLLENNFTVGKPDKNLGIIAIICNSNDELFAKYFTTALVRNVSSFYIHTKTKRSSANVNILQNRLDSIRRAYVGALYGVAASTDENVNPARAIVTVPRIKSQTEAEILGTEYAELTKNLEIAKMTLLQETPLIQVIDTPTLPLSKKRLGKLEGVIWGIFLFTLLTVIFLALKKLFRNISLSE